MASRESRQHRSPAQGRDDAPERHEVRSGTCASKDKGLNVSTDAAVYIGETPARNVFTHLYNGCFRILLSRACSCCVAESSRCSSGVAGH